MPDHDLPGWPTKRLVKRVRSHLVAVRNQAEGTGMECCVAVGECDCQLLLPQALAVGS